MSFVSSFELIGRYLQKGYTCDIDVSEYAGLGEQGRSIEDFTTYFEDVKKIRWEIVQNDCIKAYKNESNLNSTCL